MDGPALPVQAAGLSCLGDPGSTSCWEPRTRQLGHFQSVLAGHWAVLHQVPGSPRALTTTWPQNLLSFVLPAEMFSDKAFVPFPDVGEVWSQ